MNGPDPDDGWAVINLERWELWTGDPDDRLVQADTEITAGSARILRFVKCGACRSDRVLAREFATSAGRVWRLYDRKDFVTDEIDKPAHPIRCHLHGADDLIERDGPR